MLPIPSISCRQTARFWYQHVSQSWCLLASCSWYMQGITPQKGPPVWHMHAGGRTMSSHMSMSCLVITWNGVKNGMNCKPKMLPIHSVSCGVNAKEHEFTWIAIKISDSSSSRLKLSKIAPISQPTVLSVRCDCILKRVFITWWCCVLQIDPVSFNDSPIVFEEWKLIVFENVH